MIRPAIPASADPADFVADLIGVPHEDGARGPSAYDCWNLAAHVQAELFGRRLPFSDELLGNHRSLKDIIGSIRASDIRRHWRQVETPRHGDLAVMVQGVHESHIGVWIDLPGLQPGILHCSRIDGTTLATIAQVLGAYNRVAFHRCADDEIAAVAAADYSWLTHVADKPYAIIVNSPLNPLEEALIVPLEVGVPVSDALNHVDDPDDRWLVLNTLPLLRKNPQTDEDEHKLPLKAGDLVWVLPPLPLGGGQGSQVLASVLAIVASIAAPWAAGVLLPGASLFATRLLTAAIAIGANALIQSFVPAPPVVAPLASPDPTYSFGRFGNQMRPGATVPVPYGTVKREPDLLTAPWAEYENNEQLVHVLLHLGADNQELLEFGTDDTPVWTAGGGYTGAIADLAHEVAEPGAEITLFPTAVEVSPEVEGITLPEPDLVDGTVSIGPFAAVSSGETATELVFDFIFPAGLYGTENGFHAAGVSWEITAQVIDDAGVVSGFPVVIDTISFVDADTSQIRLTKRYPVQRGRYQVTVTRTSFSNATGTGAQDTLVWASLKAKRADQQPYERDSVLAIRARADATSTSSLTRWYVRTRSILPHFDTETGEEVTAPTEQIDAAVLHIARDFTHGMGLTDDQIDLEQLRHYAGIWAARGDVCCTVIEGEIQGWEALEMVLAAGRARPLFAGSVLTFMRDESRRPTRLITHADMVRGSFNVERIHFKRESPLVVRMRYRDRDGEMQSMLCPDDPDTTEVAEVVSQVMVDREQVWREGNYMAASNRLRRRYFTWVGLAGSQTFLPGETIALAHPRPNYGRAGRVLQADGLTMVLTEHHGLEDKDEGWLSLARPDGSYWGPVKAVRGADDCTVEIDEVDFAAVLEGDPDGLYDLDFRKWIMDEESAIGPDTGTHHLAGTQVEPTRAIIGTDGARAVTAMIVSVVPAAGGQVEVLAVEDHDEIHTADTADLPPLPDPAPNLSNDDAPAWTDASIVGQQQDLTGTPPPPDTFDFRIEGPVIPGATQYIAEVALVSAPTVWQVSATSTIARFDGPQGVTEDILIRVSVIGDVLAGPWTTYRATLASASDGTIIAQLET